MAPIYAAWLEKAIDRGIITLPKGRAGFCRGQGSLLLGQVDQGPAGARAQGDDGCRFRKLKFERIDGVRTQLSLSPYTPAGSTRSTAPHIRFATATAGMWGDRGCPWREHVGRTPPP